MPSWLLWMPRLCSETLLGLRPLEERCLHLLEHAGHPRKHGAELRELGIGAAEGDTPLGRTDRLGIDLALERLEPCVRTGQDRLLGVGQGADQERKLELLLGRALHERHELLGQIDRDGAHALQSGGDRCLALDRLFTGQSRHSSVIKMKKEN